MFKAESDTFVKPSVAVQNVADKAKSSGLSVQPSSCKNVLTERQQTITSSKG